MTTFSRPDLPTYCALLNAHEDWPLFVHSRLPDVQTALTRAWPAVSETPHAASIVAALSDKVRVLTADDQGYGVDITCGPMPQMPPLLARQALVLSFDALQGAWNGGFDPQAALWAVAIPYDQARWHDTVALDTDDAATDSIQQPAAADFKEVRVWQADLLRQIAQAQADSYDSFDGQLALMGLLTSAQRLGNALSLQHRTPPRHRAEKAGVTSVIAHHLHETQRQLSRVLTAPQLSAPLRQKFQKILRAKPMLAVTSVKPTKPTSTPKAPRINRLKALIKTSIKPLTLRLITKILEKKPTLQRLAVKEPLRPQRRRVSLSRQAVMAVLTTSLALFPLSPRAARPTVFQEKTTLSEAPVVKTAAPAKATVAAKTPATPLKTAPVKAATPAKATMMAKAPATPLKTAPVKAATPAKATVTAKAPVTPLKTAPVKAATPAKATVTAKAPTAPVKTTPAKATVTAKAPATPVKTAPMPVKNTPIVTETAPMAQTVRPRVDLRGQSEPSITPPANVSATITATETPLPQQKRGQTPQVPVTPSEKRAEPKAFGTLNNPLPKAINAGMGAAVPSQSPIAVQPATLSPVTAMTATTKTPPLPTASPAPTLVQPPPVAHPVPPQKSAPIATGPAAVPPSAPPPVTATSTQTTVATPPLAASPVAVVAPVAPITVASKAPVAVRAEAPVAATSGVVASAPLPAPDTASAADIAQFLTPAKPVLTATTVGSQPERPSAQDLLKALQCQDCQIAAPPSQGSTVRPVEGEKPVATRTTARAPRPTKTIKPAAPAPAF